MPEKKEEKKPLFKFGPFEQALAVLLVMGFASNPSIPYDLLGVSQTAAGGLGSLNNLPLMSPALIMLVLIAYIGYHILSRQEAHRTRNAALAKASASSSSSSGSSSSSSSKALSSSDVRGGAASSSSAPKVGDPSPKQVSGTPAVDPRKDPSSKVFKNNYFLTMQGPGRPALVPFQDGLRPKAGEAEGSLWWDNVPDDATNLMAPPLAADKIKAMMKNPWAADLIDKDIELLKMEKRKLEEEERYEKVASLLQSLLGLLLCAVDMRLGAVAIIFFLYRHFTLLHAKDQSDEKDAIEKEKKELMKRISEAKKEGADRTKIQMMQGELSRM